MGVFGRGELEVSYFGTAIIGFVFNGLVLFFLVKVTRVLKRHRSNSNSFADNEGMCTCILKRPDDSQLSKDFSIASVALVSIASFVSTVNELLYFCLCRDCTVRKVLWFLVAISAVSSYTIAPAAHFERLRVTFSDSPMQLPKWAPKLMYGTCLLFISLLCGVVVFRYSHPRVSSILVVMVMFLYLGVVSFLTRIFFKKLTAAANTTPPGTDLLEVAVRITVVVTVSMLSTVVTFLLYTLILALCPMCYFWVAVARVLYVSDWCLNSFCLMSTFSGAAVPYQRVFGRLHSLLLAHVSKTLRRATPEMTTAANINEESDKDKSQENIRLSADSI